MWPLKRAIALISFLGTASAPNRAGAQILAPALKPGTEVRIVDNVGEGKSGTFAGSTEKELQILVACGSGCEQITALHWTALRQVDAHVSDGHSIARTVMGGVIGASGAAAVTLAVGAITKGDKCQWDSGSCPALGFAVAMPIVVVMGGAIGASLGWRHEEFSWERVWPPMPRR